MSLLYRRILLWSMAISAAILPAFGAAQTTTAWPSSPIRVITPFPTGGINDIVIRIVAEKVSTELGQPIIVEQKVGAGGNIGTVEVAKSAPDGYTWLASSFPVLSVAPVLYDTLPFDPVKDFRGVAKTALAPNVLVASPKLPVSSIDELVAYGKANPKSLFYGSPAKGSSANIGTEELKRIAGFEATQVLYKGAPPALIDLLSGRIQFMLVSTTLAAQQVKAGKLKALAVMATEPSALLPEVPTIAGSRYEKALVVPWFGIHVPAGTPDAIVDRINRAVGNALKSPDVRTKLSNAGAVPAQPASPQEVDAETKAEVVRWQNLAKVTNLRQE